MKGVAYCSHQIPPSGGPSALTTSLRVSRGSVAQIPVLYRTDCKQCSVAVSTAQQQFPVEKRIDKQESSL